MDEEIYMRSSRSGTVNAGFTSIKVLAMFYATAIHAVSGIFLSVFMQKFIDWMFPSDQDDKKSTFRLLVEISFIFGILTSVCYLARNALQKIPFPLDGSNGFMYNKLKEIKSGAILTVIVLMTCSPLMFKMRRVLDRLSSTVVITN